MMKNIVKLSLAVLIAGVILSCPIRSKASEAINIYSFEDLKAMKDNPSGNYVLKNDIDCSGEEWIPFDFSGTLDGENHGLLNLNITDVSDGVRTTYDGNMKTYDTVFSGLFGCIENGTVKNLGLYGINVDVNIEKDCFVGTIAGYMDGGTIDNCVVEGNASLHVKGVMFGVGGIVGFGNGKIVNTKAETTLVNVDLDASTRDEEFLGGAYAAGYIDLDNDDINLKGYVSDHGYVHSGGMVGMYGLYPAGFEYAGYITNTRVSQDSKIFFFEDNTNRRAYCDPVNGEVLNWTYAFTGCQAPSKDSFRNETMDYSKDLYPHGDCGTDEASFTAEVIAGTHESFGYTLHTCPTDGYSFKDSYTLKVHDLGEGEEIIAPTLDSFGLEKKVCKTCGAEVYTAIDKLTPTPTPSPEIKEESREGEDGPVGRSVTFLGSVGSILLIVLLIVAVIITIIAFRVILKSGKKHGRRK
ncbi:MAG: hypothetical protein J6Z09_05310 [Lachnospiraceae bacterium]|nr:hypothetical protein [Lachnospiraceae bacterium]